MGAEQSKSSVPGGQPSTQAAAQKTCYYDLLSVERTATDDEIKKAYRRKALELHPDRNLNDTVNATRKFAEVQTAYEILSDPQERAWYDAHRDDILRGDDGTEASGGSDGSSRYYNNVRVTSTEELFTLMGRFNSSVKFDNSANGFFAILEATFAQLALEEEAAASWDGQSLPEAFPPFGSADDDYETVAKPFYRDWSNFTTLKTFSWKDKFRLSDAPDRAVRRYMEKENKKAREQAARDFNDAVRSLVAFVRKRDPRYVPNTQSEAERQKILRDSAAAQAARQRAANLEKLANTYVEPDWARSRADDPTVGLEGGFSSDAESEVQHEIECVVCNKSFKSEKQFEVHEKSKKHTKAVQQLRRQMKRENVDLGLESERKMEPASKKNVPLEVGKDDEEWEGESEQHEEETRGRVEDELSNETSEELNSNRGSEDGEEDDNTIEGCDNDDNDNDEYAPKDVVEKRFQTGRSGQPSLGSNEDDGSDNQTVNSIDAGLDGMGIADPSGNATAAEKKVGKAKAKRDKKATRQAAAAAQQSERAAAACNICRQSFSSNTKLHKHLREAHPIPATGARPSKAGSKKKK